MNDQNAVIFDMDGVLIDTYHAHYKSWLAMAEPQGLHFSEAEFAPSFGRTSREIIAALWRDRQFTDAEIAALDEKKELAFRRIIEEHFPAMPGVQDLLRSLRDAGFRLAVGSSGPPENIDLVLKKLGAKDLFQAVITARDVTRGKPDPQVFLLAAQGLGVPSAHAAVVEDAPVGIAAAKAAGMTAIGLASTGRTRQQLADADWVVDRLSELSPELIRTLVGTRRSDADLPDSRDSWLT
jgi:beta-phosphoglucomutase